MSDSPATQVLREMTRTVRCRCPKPFYRSRMYFLDTPEAYRAGCDGCGSFVWRAR